MPESDAKPPAATTTTTLTDHALTTLVSVVLIALGAHFLVEHYSLDVGRVTQQLVGLDLNGWKILTLASCTAAALLHISRKLSEYSWKLVEWILWLLAVFVVSTLVIGAVIILCVYLFSGDPGLRSQIEQHVLAVLRSLIRPCELTGEAVLPPMEPPSASTSGISLPWWVRWLPVH